jgi:Flp pilus assembly pilin Flp
MKMFFSPTSPLGYLELNARHRLARLRTSQGDAGASAVEWVVIAAIAIVIVVAVGAALQAALVGKAGDISTEIGDAGTP